MTPGDKRGLWTFIRPCDAPKYAAKTRQFGVFRCDCGREKVIGISEVVQGHSRSCGCQMRTAWRRAIKGHVVETAAGQRKRRGE